MSDNLKQAEKRAACAPSEASCKFLACSVSLAHLRPSCKGLGPSMQLDSCDCSTIDHLGQP